MTPAKNQANPTSGPQMGLENFRVLMTPRARPLLATARHVALQADDPSALTRPCLAELLSQSTQLEELLDAYGARNNRQWYRFRCFTAAIKLFSDVSYELLHIRHAIPSYRLLPIDEDFVGATEHAVDIARGVLVRASESLLGEASDLGLDVPDQPPEGVQVEEQLLPGRLPHDRTIRGEESASQTVTRLTTAFLDLAAESQLVHSADRLRPEHDGEVPEIISEESLRDVQDRFHNLQSRYDTYVSQTRTEGLDPGLPVLRGHISVVFHLLKTATAFSHYYERHVRPAEQGKHDEPLMIRQDDLAEVLTGYAIHFASRYISSARSLCQRMLRRYAELGRIEVPVPRYRGFHVRPSTLVAKIVQHYGSEVEMRMDGESYDASSPMEVFRANEKINARKRKWLAQQIAKFPFVHCDETCDHDVAGTVQRLVLELAQQGRLVIYEQPLEVCPKGQNDAAGSCFERIVAEVGRLQAMGKIDIRTELNVVFVGDKRVLADLKALAECGYGEDNYGNNIALPPELAYLRR